MGLVINAHPFYEPFYNITFTGGNAIEERLKGKRVEGIYLF